jgi:hypothetical protein
MRHCNKCNRNLPENKFGKNGNGSRSICKDCQCERIKQGQRETRDYIQSLKTKCNRCGYDKCVEALDFHHTNPQEKDSVLSHYSRRVFSLATKELIDREVEKCEVLCANCHREEHSKRNS